VNPQSFRHSVATSVGKDNAENSLMAMDLLDHASFATTERYYIVAQAEEAHRHLEQLLEARRRASAHRRKLAKQKSGK
jgi:integrase